MNEKLKDKLKPFLDKKLTEDNLNILVDIIASEAFKERSSKAGKKGGETRATRLSPERRIAIAKNAVEKRWNKNKSS